MHTLKHLERLGVELTPNEKAGFYDRAEKGLFNAATRQGDPALLARANEARLNAKRIRSEGAAIIPLGVVGK